VDPKKTPGRQLRKASTGHGNEHDQHGYQQDPGQEEEHHKHAVEDHDPVSKFGGKKHSVTEDHDIISSHRKRREEAEQRKKEILRKTQEAALAAESINKDRVYHSPKPSPKLHKYLLHKDKDDLHSEDEEESSNMRSILHQVSASGDLSTTTRLLQGKTSREMELLLNAQDSRGWQPLHEAIRGGHTALVKYFVEDCGASFETRTGEEHTFGGTALWWAQKLLDPTHPIISLLTDLGAPVDGEEV